MYQRIRELFALASDYDESGEETLRFFAFMQNKMHYAAIGLTAAADRRCSKELGFAP